MEHAYVIEIGTEDDRIVGYLIRETDKGRAEKKALYRAQEIGYHPVGILSARKATATEIAESYPEVRS